MIVAHNADTLHQINAADICIWYLMTAAHADS